jgi:hypothetical protein
MEINPRFNGGMVKTLGGLQPIYKNVNQSVGGSVVLPPFNSFNNLSIQDGGKVKQSYGVKPLKFLM